MGKDRYSGSRTAVHDIEPSMGNPIVTKEHILPTMKFKNGLIQTAVSLLGSEWT